jgi:hypothetical protein
MPAATPADAARTSAATAIALRTVTVATSVLPSGRG